MSQEEELNPITDWLNKISQYESAHKQRQIHLTKDEILTQIEKRLGELNEEMQTLEPYTLERSIVWFEFTVLRRVYDDLLCIPNEVRPWLTNPERWDEVRHRVLTRHTEGKDRKSKKQNAAFEARIEQIIDNISE